MIRVCPLFLLVKEGKKKKKDKKNFWIKENKTSCLNRVVNKMSCYTIYIYNLYYSNIFFVIISLNFIDNFFNFIKKKLIRKKMFFASI